MLSTAAALLGSAVLSSASQYALNEANIKNQRFVNDTAIGLANTQHQREVADLRLAGLNPILSAQGSGAAVPSLGTPSLESIAKDLPSTARELGRYASQSYAESVTGQKLSNDYQAIVNSAAESERAASAIRADNDRVLANAESEALDAEMGITHDRHGNTQVNGTQYGKFIDLVREGVRSDLKLRANSNWRSNLSSFVPFAAPISANSARGIGTLSSRAAMKVLK